MAGGSSRRPSLRRRLAAAAGVAASFAAFLLVVWSYAAERPLLAVLRSARASAAEDVACYFPQRSPAGDVADADLPDAASLRPTESSIFFHETTCGGGDAGVRLTARQACAVESAALLHPHRTVYVLVTASGGPVTARRNSTEGWSAGARALLEYPNVRVARLRVGRYARGTPLHEWFAEGVLATSRWPREHAADALRYLTLWRFGGTYLDLDVVVTRSLDGLRNFAGAESEEAVGTAAMGFARDSVGATVASACLRELRRSFRGNQWGNNGPGVITRVLKRICRTEQVSEMNEEQCMGFHVLPPSAFYPVPWQNWELYFQEANARETLQAVAGSYAVHVWNKKSAAANVSFDSQQPYAAIARKFCPRVVKIAGAYF